MRLRRFVLAGAVLLALGASPILTWPLVEGLVTRSAENRLRQETGQDWHIRGGAGLSFRPAPQVTLNDVSVGDRDQSTGISASIKRVRLSNPWMLMLGGMSINAVAEDINLRAPLSAASSEIKLDGIAAIRAELVGTTLDLDKPGRMVVASAELADFGLTLSKGASKTSIDAKLALAEHDASLTSELSVSSAGKSLTGPIRIAIAPRDSAMEPGETQRHRLEASARVHLLPTSLAFDSLAGSIDGEPFSGTLTIALGTKPKVVGDLAFEALTLTREVAPLRSDKTDSLVVTVPADAVPVPAWFNAFDASSVLRFARLTFGEIRLKEVELKAEVKRSGLDLGLVKATAFEGSVRGRYVLMPESDDSGRHQLSLFLSGLRVVSVLSELAGARGIDGTGSLRVDLQAVGDTPDSLRQSLSGSAELLIKDGQLNGLDLNGTMGILPKIIQGVPQIGALAPRLDHLSASFAITDGRALTNDLDIRTAVLTASGIGSIDLFARTLDIHMTPAVGSGPRTGDDRGRINLPIHVTGSWSNPSVSADIAELAKDPSRALQTLQEFGVGLLGANGDKLGKTLRQNLSENLDENLGGLLGGLFLRQDLPLPEQRRP